MKAKFQGRCGQCRRIVLQGEEITWLAGTVYCESCANSSMFGDVENVNEIGKPPKEKCLSCWTVHAGECY